MKKLLSALFLLISVTAAQAYAPLDNSTITLNASSQVSCTTATFSQVGCSKPDGTILTISGSTESVAKGTNTAFGVAQADNATLNATAGVFSCNAATAGVLGCVRPDGTIITNTAGVVTVAKGSAAAFGVLEGDGATLNITTGVISLNTGHANTWSAAQTFTDGDLLLAGSSSGNMTLHAPAAASNYGITFPALTDTLSSKTSTDTFTNKTFDTAGTGNSLKINGTQITAIGGNTATVGTVSGTLTSGHCVQFDSSGNLVDAGGACTTGGGGATNTSSAQYTIPVYTINPTGTTVGGSSAITSDAGGDLIDTGFIKDIQAIAATSTDGLLLTDTTAATLSNQKWSPRLHFHGLGWGTTAGTSQAVDWIEETQPVQGAVPSGNLVWSSNIAAGGYNPEMTLTSAGVLSATSYTGAGTGLTGTAASLTAGLATATVAQTGTGTTYAASVSPALTGEPTAPTQSAGDSNLTDIATVGYVATAINNQVDMHDPVIAATTAALNFSPAYNNGSSGVGATLTATTVGALIIDGVTPTQTGGRYLVQNQAAPLQNGCYVLTTLGVVITTDYVLTRCTDFNQVANIQYGDTFPVLQGTTNANQQFTMNSQTVTSIGTAGSTGNITFAQTSGGSQLAAGTGITLTGNSIAVTSPIATTLGGTGVSNNAASTLAISGNFASTLTVTNTTAITLPTSGTLLTTTGSAASLTSFPTLNQNTSGSAATLTTPRTINGVNFDGSAAITTPAYSGYNAQTTTYAPVAGDLGKLVSFIGAGGNATWTMTSCTTLGAGWWAILDNPTAFTLTLLSSAGTIDGYAAGTGFKMYPGETRYIECGGTNFITRVLHGFFINTTTTFTFSVPPGYQGFDCEIWGGGAGGQPTVNGGGGGGGTFNHALITAAIMGSTTQTCTVGAGGAITPTAGGETSIGAILTAYGGGIGSAGAANSTGGGGGGPTGVGGNGSANSQPAGGTPAGTTFSGAGGGSGSVAGVANSLGGGSGGGVGGGDSLGWGGGGGGGGNSSSAANGGCAVYGGGGGSNGSSGAIGGKSLYGGNGGSAASVNGVVPGGGGASHATTPGTGASGQIWIRGII